MSGRPNTTGARRSTVLRAPTRLMSCSSGEAARATTGGLIDSGAVVLTSMPRDIDHDDGGQGGDDLGDAAEDRAPVRLNRRVAHRDGHCRPRLGGWFARAEEERPLVDGADVPVGLLHEHPPLVPLECAPARGVEIVLE